MATKESWRRQYDKKLQKLEKKGPRTIGERLKVLRYRSGKSIEEVTAESDISFNTLRRWESDANIPALRELIIVAECYGASLDYIVLGRENPHETHA